MTKRSGLAELRAELDEAITYGRFSLARKLSNKGLRESDKEGLLGEIEYFKGQIEILNENYPEAIEHFDRAIRHNPGDGAAFNDRALCMVELGIIDGAFAYFDRGIKAEPDYANVYHNKGWLLNKTGRYSEAIKYFKQALELEPGRAVTYENLGDTLANLCDYKGAIEAYNKAVHFLGAGCGNIKKQLMRRIKLFKFKVSVDR